MKVNRLVFALLFAFTAGIASAASDPGSQALSLYKAIQKQNWRALYYLAAFAPSIKKQLEGPDKFAVDVQKGIDDSPNAKMVKDLFNSIRDIKVGKAAIKGNKATVPTSATLTVQGKTKYFHGLARMIKENGVWKWDLSFTSDAEKATSQALQELMGKPAG